jgi:hypothetical protein
VSGQLHAPAALTPGERAPGCRSDGGNVQVEERSECETDKVPPSGAEVMNVLQVRLQTPLKC